MHKNKRPTSDLAAESSQGRKGVLHKLLEEGNFGFSKQIRKFLMLRQGILDRDSDTQMQVKKAESYLKNNGFLESDVEIGNFREALEQLDQKIENYLIFLNQKIPDKFMLDYPELNPGKVIENKTFWVRIGGDVEMADNDPRFKRILTLFLEELNKFKSSTRYLAHVHIADETIAIQINHGKHKGYLALFCPNDPCLPHVLYFKHHEHGQGLYPENRVSFVRDALHGFRASCRVDTLERGRSEVVSFIFTKSEYFEYYFSKFVRLSRAVKDLDLTLREPTHAKCAAILFEAGVTNMVEALMPILDSRQNSDNVSTLPICDHEKEILLRFIQYKTQLYNHIKWVRSSQDTLRRAKDLNFEILALITRMQFLLISCKREGKLVLKREANATLREIEKRTREMAKICDSMHPYSSQAEYSKKAGEILEKFRYSIKDASSWILDEMDCKAVMDIFGDRGGELKLDTINTVEELVRFLHSEIVGFPDIRRGLRAGVATSSDIFFLDGVDSIGNRFFCINAEEEKPLKTLDTYTILRSTIRDVDHPSMLAEGRAVAILGSDLVEISMPMGKHYSEISADLDHKNDCHVLRLKYFDTEYTHAQQRKRFIKLTLEHLGFELDQGSMEEYNRLVKATFRTSDYKKWKKTYSELVRLMLSAENLDLGCDSDYARDLFLEGFTMLALVPLFLRDLNSSDEHQVVNDFLNILNNNGISNGDKRAFTNFFFSSIDYWPSNIIPLIRDYSVDELDRIVCHTIDLEFAAKEEKDKKRFGRLRRLGKAIDKLIEEKDKNK